MPRKKPDAQRVTIILSDAKLLGDRAAAEKHGITTRTLSRYKAEAKGDPVVTEKIAETVERVHRSWHEHARTVRARMVDKLDKMVADATQDQIREVAGAFKLVDDSIRADRVVNNLAPERDEDGGRTGSGAQVASTGGPDAAPDGVRRPEDPGGIH